jgi:hypothetical protein
MPIKERLMMLVEKSFAADGGVCLLETARGSAQSRNH